MSRFGDTPFFGTSSLCATCRSAQNVSGFRLNDTFTICRTGTSDPLRMPQPVVKCSEYDDKRNPPIWQLEKIAWRFSPDDRKKIAGFGGGDRIYSPQEWKNRVKEGKETDDEF